MSLHVRRYGVRIDRAGLARPLVRPDGSMMVEGFVAREGILPYEDEQGGEWRELVPGDTLATSVAELVGLPVTMEHPPDDVTPDNWDKYAVGTVVSAEYDLDECAIRCVLSIHKREILDAIEDGKCELSPGYMADVDEVPGENDHGTYDAVQSGRSYNHVAFVDEARGGPTVRARVDSSRNVCTAPRASGDHMNPNLLALAVALGLGTEFTSDNEVIRSVKARTDSMESDLQAAEKEKEDMEGVEKIDAAEHEALKDQNGELMKMVDSLLGEREKADMKPMADAYGVEMTTEDRADGVYVRIYEKISNRRVDAAQVNLHEVRGMVRGHYAAQSAARPQTQRRDGVEAGRQAWANASRQPVQDSRQELFRPGPSAIAERRADSAHKLMLKGSR